MNKMPQSKVSLSKMQRESKWALAAGQIWHTGVASIEILTLGKRLIHYRITKDLGRKWASAQISAIQAMVNYLRHNDAKLIAECQP